MYKSGHNLSTGTKHEPVKFRCMQADGDKINIDLIKYQEHKGPSPRIFTVIGFLPSKKMNKDLELDLASGFGHASGWNAQQFTCKAEYVADSNDVGPELQSRVNNGCIAFVQSPLSLVVIDSQSRTDSAQRE